MHFKNSDPCFFKLSFICSIILFFLQGICFAQSASSFERAGDKAFAKGDYYNAAYFYNQALELKSNDLDLTYKKAEAQRLYNDYRHASLSYSQVVSEDQSRKYPLAIFYLAEMKKYLGLYETAKGFYTMFNIRHKDTSDYFALKSRLEIRACDSALKITASPLTAEVTNMGSNVNSVYSDFAGLMINNTDLFFSSNKFEVNQDGEKGKKIFISKILEGEKKENGVNKTTLIDSIINNEKENNSNAAISPDKKLMVFCRCTEDPVNRSTCKLYQSKFIKNGWTMPQMITAPGINEGSYTYTQPALSTNGNAGYVLYFVSDRNSGFGKLDIWQSFIDPDGNYTPPINAGGLINTFGDDITPFYSKGEEALYFSSEGHEGIGGFDVFRSKFTQNGFEKPVNIGPPLNSSYNDIFFTVNNNDTTGVLTSNRPGSMYIKAETCCYDLYYYIIPKEEKKKMTGEVKKSIGVITLDETPVSTRDSATKSIIENELEFTFPLSLYFDNDQPDPGTIKETTARRYDGLYKDYVSRISMYSKVYSDDFKNPDKAEAVKRIEGFFSGDVDAGYNRLDKMSGYILKLLQKGKTVQITVKGSTSPLADNKYNYHLSQRRISCFINYINSFQSGVFKEYITTKKFEIKQEAHGEEEFENISDKASNKAQSIYSPEAARARKIEVTSLSVK